MPFYKNIFKICIFQIISFLLITNIVYSHSFNEKSFNVLVLNSYNPDNEWERLINAGLKSKLSSSPSINLNIEYIDSKTLFSKQYRDSYMNLLNMKYSGYTFNAVLTVDDEALSFLREYIFEESSILYKKPTIFIGVNSEVFLSDAEKEFISGVIEGEDNLRYLNLLIKLHSNVDEIVVLLDNSTYSEIVKNNIASMQPLASKPLKITYINDDYLEDVIPKVQIIDSKTSVIIIVGEFKSKATDSYLILDDTISILRNNSDAPIYTKVEPYIYCGAIGGIIDVGEYHGNVAGNLLLKLSSGLHITDIPLVYNSLDITMFNYDALCYYNINPLLLPKESIILNRGFFDFLLPKPLKILLWLSILGVLLLILYLIFNIFKNKKQMEIKDAVYKKAIETEKLKSTFITTMSHEFRTPINIILSTAHLLSLKTSKDAVDIEYLSEKLNYITKNGNRLLKIVNNIIDVTRLESGFLTANFTYKNIVEVIEDTVLSTIDLANDFNIDITFDTDNEEIFTYIDVSKIERCILNLLSNSIKFTQSGGSIYVHVSTDNNDIIISITDTGCGIPENELKHIFDRFHQADSSLQRCTEGSGLGLYIVKGLIRLHNGTISVKSTVGKGSTFIITLPLLEYYDDSSSYSFLDDDLSRLVTIELSDLLKND